MTATTLMLTVVNCQPLKPARVVRGLHQTDTAARLALQQDVSRHRRRLAAYHVMTQNVVVDDDDDNDDEEEEDDDNDNDVDDDNKRYIGLHHTAWLCRVAV